MNVIVTTPRYEDDVVKLVSIDTGEGTDIYMLSGKVFKTDGEQHLVEIGSWTVRHTVKEPVLADCRVCGTSNAACLEGIHENTRACCGTCYSTDTHGQTA